MTQSPRPLNAWKHGGYSNLGVLPGEDPKEFDDFHQSLIDEWQPSGSTECDAVLSLAKCMWRKCRLTVYPRMEAVRKKVADRMSDFSGSPIFAAYEKAYRESVGDKPPTPLAEEREREWQRIEEETEAHKLQDQLIEQQLREFDHMTLDGLMQELELDARLDTKIDRLIKRLLHLKAAKQMIRAEVGSPTVSPPPPRLASCAT